MTGQIDCEVTPKGVLPPGGSTGQELAKTSNTDFATAWVDEGTVVGTNIKTMVAAADLNGNFFVKTDSTGKAAVPDLTVLADGLAVIGITTGAIASGASGPVQTGGVMADPSWNWTPGGAVYVGAAGLPTQSVPSGKFLLQGGVALDATTIEITLGSVISTPL